MSRAARMWLLGALVGAFAVIEAEAAPRRAALEEPAPPPAVIEVTPATVVAFGAYGDEASIERAPSSTSAIVLLNPHGEDCTLRFELEIGESLLLRAGGDGQRLLCELGLVSVVNSAAVQFAYTCSPQDWRADEAKCAPVADGGSPGP